MATLQRVEIFAAGGPWNGNEFSISDLDDMVRAFEDEQQAGRLPVTLGHEAPGTDPARGWITKVWREGRTLFATLADVSEDVAQGIREGRWRFCSVEILRDVTTAAGKCYAWMLDRLALLGSARPAVDGLRPLHESLSRRAQGLTFAQALSFTREIPGDDLAVLRRENERLRLANHRQAIDHAIESDVRARIVVPAAREQFARMMRLTDDAAYQRVSIGDWQAFRGSQPRPPALGPASRAPDYAGEVTGGPDAQLVEKARAYLHDNELRHLQLTGERLSFERAAGIVGRANPALLEAWRLQNGETD